jgi:hypothetical protein
VDALVRAFADPILSAIADRAPDFEDDFTTADRGWNLHFHGESGPKDRLEIVDGVVRMTLFDGARGVLSHEKTTLKNFVLTFDCRQVSGSSGFREEFNLSIPDGHVGLLVKSSSRSWQLGRDQDGQWQHWYLKPSDPRNVIGPVGETTHVVIVAKGPQLAVYLNHIPVAYVRDQVLDVSHQMTFGCHGEIDAICEFDNVKAWNLDNVPGLP